MRRMRYYNIFSLNEESKMMRSGGCVMCGRITRVSGVERDERSGGREGGGAGRTGCCGGRLIQGAGSLASIKKAYIQTASAQVSVTQPSRLITKHRLPSFGPFPPPLKASVRPPYLGPQAAQGVPPHVRHASAASTRPSGYTSLLSEAVVHKEVAP